MNVIISLLFSNITQLLVFISNKQLLYIFKGPLLSSIMIKLVMYDFLQFVSVNSNELCFLHL